jgi:broad specificity phosphatase PhoE
VPGLDGTEYQKPMAMTQFILVRHGQTEWNVGNRFRGRADLLLDETGLRQALAAARYLKDWPIAAVYSSPLKRTLETAAIIARQLKLPVASLEGLLDIDFGAWQGLLPDEAAKRDSGLFRLWLESPQKVRFPGGESLDDVRHRVLGAVEGLAADHRDQVVVLVSHMVVCKVLMCAMLGLDNASFWQVRQDVCALNSFQIIDGMPSVSVVNDTCHLRGFAAR